MIRLLVVFDRSGRRLPLYCHLAPEASVGRARLRAEEEFGGPTVEVVVLSADSVDTMRRTHARYFPRADRP